MDQSPDLLVGARTSGVVITLEIATEALAEQSDSTGVTFIEETLGAPRERNKDLTKCEF